MDYALHYSITETRGYGWASAARSELVDYLLSAEVVDMMMITLIQTHTVLHKYKTLSTSASPRKAITSITFVHALAPKSELPETL